MITMQIIGWGAPHPNWKVVVNYLVGDGGEDAVVVVDAEGGVDVGQRVGPRPEEDAQRDVHVLKVLRARDRRNVLRPRSKKKQFPISLKSISISINNASLLASWFFEYVSPDKCSITIPYKS